MKKFDIKKEMMAAKTTKQQIEFDKKFTVKEIQKATKDLNEKKAH